MEEARAKNNIGIYDVEKFDDLPDFPDWEGMKRNVQRGAAEGGMV